MTIQAIIVIAVIIFIIISLYKEIVGPAMTFIIAVVVLGVTQILEPSEIIRGFANEQLAIIVMLLILGDIFRKVSTLDNFFSKIFKKAKTVKTFTARLMFMVFPISAFINNTPLVAVMMPIVHNNAKKFKFPISKLLIPLSFAAILGGNITLIGTSTNLIVNGMLAEQKIIPGTPLLGFFDFTVVGLTMAILGTIYVVFFGLKKLPHHENIMDSVSDFERNYVIEARLKSGSHLIGKTLIEARIKNLNGLTLVEVLRENMRITAVPQDMILMEEDILLFTGDTDSLGAFVKSHEGFEIPTLGMFSRKENAKLIEVVISYNSTIIGKSLKEIQFRATYDASVLAIFRNGTALVSNLNTEPLRAGDALLLLTGTYFEQRTNDVTDFIMVSNHKLKEKKQSKSLILYIGFITAVILASFGLVKFFNGLLMLLSVLVLLKVINPKNIIKSVDFQLVLIIALALSLGLAMTKSGVADIFSDGLLTVLKPMGKVAVLAGIYIITTLLSAIISVRASVAIVFPVAMTMALSLGVNPIPFVLTVAYAATANFMTPIGYQTNLMVYGPGNYKFKDFLRIGIPLTIIYFIVTISLLSWMYF
jgi:di/tricarboxylate transporter